MPPSWIQQSICNNTDRIKLLVMLYEDHPSTKCGLAQFNYVFLMCYVISIDSYSLNTVTLNLAIKLIF